MKQAWLVAILIVLVGISVWIHLAAGDERRKAPPAMTAGQIMALPEDQVFRLVTVDLRWKLAELDPASLGRWRTLPASARHVLALSCTESDEAPGVPPAFEGFGFIVANPSPTEPTLAEIAEAYTAIGAPACAEIVRQAMALAEHGGSAAPADDPPGRHADRFATLNRQLPAASAKAGVVRLIRSFIRDHAEEIASARIGG